MGVAKKGKRKLTVDGRRYLWYIAQDLDAAGMVALNVLSNDKRFIVRYYLAEPVATRHVVVIGAEFAGHTRTGPGWKRYRCPQFGTSSAVIPADVRSLIMWCHAETSDRHEVDWRGQVVGPAG